MHTPPSAGRARPGTLARSAGRAAAAVALAATVLGGAALPAGASVQTPSAPAFYGMPATTSWDEAELFHKINGVRWMSGRSPLYFHGVLGDQASAWSAWMAQQGGLSHHPDLGAEASRVTASWQGTAEIVGRGPDVVSVLNAFMASPPHRDKILGNHHAMGVGIVHARGEYWVTVRFLR